MYVSRLILALAASSLFAQTPAVPGQDKIKLHLEPVNPNAPAAPLTPEEAAKIIITVGDVKITAGEYMAMVDTLPPNYRHFARSTNRSAFAENVIKVLLLSQEARRRKFDQDARTQAQLAFQANNTLASRFYEQMLNETAVDEDALKQFYEAHKSEYERVRARHILIRHKDSVVPVQSGRKDLTMDEALTKIQGVRERLVKGEDFAALARAESDDINSAGRGGDLGLLSRKGLTPEFEETAFSLPEGKLSEPVKTAHGFHLILVDKKEMRGLDELKPELEKRVRAQKVDQALRQVFEKVPVSVDESFFGKGTVTLASPPARQTPPADK